MRQKKTPWDELHTEAGKVMSWKVNRLQFCHFLFIYPRMFDEAYPGVFSGPSLVPGISEGLCILVVLSLPPNPHCPSYTSPGYLDTSVEIRPIGQGPQLGKARLYCGNKSATKFISYLGKSDMGQKGLASTQ
jgi:hypothetical protein